MFVFHYLTLPSNKNSLQVQPVQVKCGFNTKLATSVTTKLCYNAFYLFTTISQTLSSIFSLCQNLIRFSQMWSTCGGDNLRKMAKNCMKIKKSIFLEQNSWGEMGDNSTASPPLLSPTRRNPVDGTVLSESWLLVLDLNIFTQKVIESLLG